MECEMMSFWVMDNTKDCCARIHMDYCHTCKNGKGPESRGTGKWHGPFETYSAAQSWALHTRKYVDNCKLCNPA
jgi:hypothetical protein